MVTPDLQELLNVLQKLTGLHKELLEVVRSERQSLVDADLKSLQESVFRKEALIETIRLAESRRAQLVEKIAFDIGWRKPAAELPLSKIIVHVQGDEPRLAEQLRSALNALKVMVERIQEQNGGNRELVARSLRHIESMKRNVLGDAAPAQATYTQQGTKAGVSNAGPSRLISREA